MRGNMKVWIVVVWIVAATWIWWNVPDLLCLVALIVVPTWIWWNERVVLHILKNQKFYAPPDPYPGWTPPPLGYESGYGYGSVSMDLDPYMDLDVFGGDLGSVSHRPRGGPAAAGFSIYPDSGRPRHRLIRYQTVEFSTKNATKTSYTQFIEDLRARLASGKEQHGIPVMRERSTVSDNERFIFVKLSNVEAVSITLAIDVTNAYVVAYRTGNQSFFFLREDNPDPAIENLFPYTERYTFPFSGSYTDLERVAGTTRADIALGMLKLGYAITQLGTSNLTQQKCLARSLIVVIQMVAEAVRFKPIEKRVCHSFGILSWMAPPKLDTELLEYENNWGAMSKEIQQSNGVGVSPSTPVAIMLFVRRTGQP